MEEVKEDIGQTCRMSGDERHAQLLKTAMKLFSEKGFSGTTTREIAKCAGISEAMVFRHFENKDELYNTILDHKACAGGMTDFPWECPELASLMATKDDFGFFYSLAKRALENHKKDVDFLRLLLHSALEGHDLSEKFLNQFVARLYDFIGDYIRIRQADGAFRVMEPRILVRSFLGMLVHHSLSNLLLDTERRLLDIPDEEAACEFARVFLGGIKNNIS